MTKQEMLRLLQPYLHPDSDFRKSGEDLPLQDVTFSLQKTLPHHIVFYHLKGGYEKAVTDFESRLKGAGFGLLVLDHPPPPRLGQLKNTVVVRKGEFLPAQKAVLDHFYPLDRTSKKLVGVTGTNGKSTTVELSRQVANRMGHKSCSLGTLGIRTWDNRLLPTESGLTTPPYIELRKILYRLFQDHEACFMEVSSHALAMERIFGLEFQAIAWTSFGQDHLDFHPTMEDYFQVKKSLYTHFLGDKAAFFIPQKEVRLRESLKDCQIHPGRSVEERGVSNLPLFLTTPFNKNNLEVSLGINEYLWKETPPRQLDFLRPLEGRFSLYRIGGKTLVIDFAHTPDALESICRGIREIFPAKRPFLVFGCGGDRDPHKRPLMGQVALQFGERIFLTMDNPRYEDPQKIMDDICRGLTLGPKVTIQFDREKAIRSAYREMGEQDVLLIAGKGHEDYQLIQGVKHDYSDLGVLKKISSEEGKNLEEIND